jgi:DNA-binding transcriptional MerR regulator
MNIQKMQTIGALSTRTKVKVTTIRYYESIGLMADPKRSSSGQRLYTDEAIECLHFIRHARELGFSMDAIRELIQLQTHTSDDCAEVDEIAQRHLLIIQHRLAQLAELEKELMRMITLCKGGTIGTCTVMECLSNHEKCVTETHEKIDLNLNAT